MQNKYHILILSNPKNEEFIEDKYIANAFIEDNSPHMNLEKLDIALRKNVLNEYKKNIIIF